MEIYVAFATMLFCSDAHSVTVKSYDFIQDESHKPLQRSEAGAYYYYAIATGRGGFRSKIPIEIVVILLRIRQFIKIHLLIPCIL